MGLFCFGMVCVHLPAIKNTFEPREMDSLKATIFPLTGKNIRGWNRKNIWKCVCTPISSAGKMTRSVLKMLWVGHYLNFPNHGCFQDYDKFYFEKKKWYIQYLSTIPT